jgi:hypothetical protein
VSIALYRSGLAVSFSRSSQHVIFALFATFGASAALHAYLIGIIDVWAALSWAMFFLAQPVLILIERKLRVRRWPPVGSRAWTITSLSLLLPLLLNPLLPLFNTSL